MARREKRVTIPSDDPENRDGGKTYFLKEMPATQAEDWAMRALLALTAAGAEIPDDLEGAGMAGLAVMGVQALTGLKHADVKPLMDEMFTCVQACPDRGNPNVVRPLVEDDIEEVQTRLLLRKEILQLHVGFSLPGAPSKSTSGMPGAAGGVSRITRTSPAR
ncbi:hypothetical protein DA075_10210 [Methylobacterium currus]|uniref:Uncharacterized protein n=1 Tax=Methylobacterium currus TaxID=2051553 RepID=A0A2R4WI75_9HYPH|nr:hypothetical protein [Methylobacterium currus]AWB21240.1 hypothetical protein DA075_10210 [Methylobacterium currus]